MSKRRSVQAAALVAIVSAVLASHGEARAEAHDPAALKLACVQASDKAQQLRVSGKLVAARDALKLCVVDGCPSVVREACSQWLGEVNSSLPSIVIGAQDSDGKDLLDLKVSIDGQLVTEHLGGRAVPIDPGRHKMRYEKGDGTVLEEDILVGEGTKNKQVTVVFPSAGKPSAGGAPGGPVGPIAPVSTTRGPSTANTAIGTVLAVVGAGGLGTALYLDLSTTSNVNALKATTCAAKGTCNPSTVSGYELDYDLAGVALGVGIVAVALATYVFIGHPFGAVATADPGHTTAAPAPRFQVVPSPRGGGFAVAF